MLAVVTITYQEEAERTNKVTVMLIRLLVFFAFKDKTEKGYYLLWFTFTCIQRAATDIFIMRQKC